MRLSIEGYLNPVASNKPRWGGGTERVYLKLELKDDILRCKYKGHSLAIEAGTNKLIDGEDLVNRLMLHTISVKKCCPTCVFKAISEYRAGNIKKTHHFPPMMLRSEELNYTMRGGKRVNISKYYQFNKEDEEANCFISYNGSSLQPIALDFTKLTDLDQISKKVKTIVVFQ
jgi:hypothetical protein